MNCCKELIKNHKSFEECFESATSTPREKGMQFKIIKRTNPKENFCRIKVDDCLIKDNSIKKCDYVFVRCSNNDFYFVELKRRNKVVEAYEQIIRTIEYFKENKFNVTKDNTYGFIASAGIPTYANLKLQKLQANFKKDYGKELKKGTNCFMYYI